MAFRSTPDTIQECIDREARVHVRAFDGLAYDFVRGQMNEVAYHYEQMKRWSIIVRGDVDVQEAVCAILRARRDT